jgi:hypothetical protein
MDNEESTDMTKTARTALADIRRRHKAIGHVATRSEAVAALNDRRTLLEIIQELQLDALERTRA